jgi:hypothetical protein
MQFDTVKTGELRILGSLSELSTMPGISWRAKARGVTKGVGGRSRLTLPLAATALGATGSAPSRKLGSDIRPTCHSCRKMRPPA